MRAGAPAVAAALVALAACTGGDGTPVVTSTSAPSTSSTTVATTSTTTAVADPAGSLTLRVRGLTLPDPRAGGTGLRVVVRATSATLTVRRRGGTGAVSACPLTPGGCAELGPQSTVQVPSPGGVELRGSGGEATSDELSVTYVPADRTTTIVTPARPAGACAARPCEATYSLTPGRGGAISVEGSGGGGRPRLVLTAGNGGSNRTLATVEGGGSLSIRATVEAGLEATLLHHQQTPDPVAPLTVEISWP